MSTTAQHFLRLFSDPAPALRVKFGESDVASKTIPVQHRLGSTPGALSLEFLDSLRVRTRIEAFREFYHKHDGAELCRTFDARYDQERPLLEIKPAKSIGAFTSRYMPGGDLGWTIDLNKSKALYRTSAFNILRPIARDFQALLGRMAKDLPTFLRLIRATVTLRGDDGDNYGYMPVEYLANIKKSAIDT